MFHGLSEIFEEPVTQDGHSSGSDLSYLPHAADGLNFGGLHLERAHRSGVTRILTPPLTSGFTHGISAAFRTGASSGEPSFAPKRSRLTLQKSSRPTQTRTPQPRFTSRLQIRRNRPHFQPSHLNFQHSVIFSPPQLLPTHPTFLLHKVFFPLLYIRYPRTSCPISLL